MKFGEHFAPVRRHEPAPDPISTLFLSLASAHGERDSRIGHVYDHVDALLSNQRRAMSADVGLLQMVGG